MTSSLLSMDEAKRLKELYSAYTGSNSTLSNPAVLAALQKLQDSGADTQRADQAEEELVTALRTHLRQINALKEDSRGNLSALERYALLIRIILQRKKDTEDMELKCKSPLQSLGIKFQDVAGLQKEKDEFRLNFIYPQLFPELFRSASKGILLYGPPGTGKTFLAKAAIAELSNIALFEVRPSDVKGKYEGQTESLIDGVFRCAARTVRGSGGRYTKALLFFDEFDSLAADRSANDDPSINRSVNALLQAMDGIGSSSKVIYMAATNFPDSIDPAIRRRFTSEVLIDLPDAASRRQLIRQALADAYNFPNITPDQRRVVPSPTIKGGLESVGDNSLDNIARFGQSGIIQVEVPSGFLSNSTALVGQRVPIVDAAVIEELVRQTGPQPAARDTLQLVQRPLSDISAEGKSLFGLGPSDINKFMQRAIRLASLRALSPNSKFRLVKKYFVFVPNQATAFPVMGREPDVLLKDLSAEDQQRVISFDIRPSDFQNAWIGFHSSLKPADYQRVVQYASGG